MKILVTGATGFLGGRLCLYLKGKGQDVSGTGRDMAKGEKLQSNEIHFIPADLSGNVDFIENFDYVVHSGALSSPWGKYEDFYKANVLATRNICEVCLKNKVKRLVHISTPSIYFDFKDRFNIKENDPLPRKKVNYYAQTKWLAEREVDKYCQNGLSVITLRPRAVFGAGDNALLPRLIQANNTKFIPVMREKDVLVDLTHVDNVCHAIWLALNADDKYSGRKYNVTNGQPVYLISFLKNTMERLGYCFKSKNILYVAALCYAFILENLYKYVFTGQEPAFTRYTVALLAKDQTLDISAIKKDLGYTPLVTVAQGIEEVVNWWKYEDKNI